MPHITRSTTPRLLPRAAFAATLALGAVLAVPAAAHASTIYPPSGSCTTTPTAQAGGTISFECAAETFSPDEAITITVTGENGAASRIGMLKFAITTASGNASSEADGSLAA